MQELFGTEDVFGTYQNLYKAKTEVPEIAEVAQDGGIVSTLLAYAFKQGLIDGAIVSVTSEDDPWIPEPKIITSYEELLKSAGTRYSLSPNIASLAQYREAVEELLAQRSVGEDWLRLAFVGTPCQALGVRKMQIAIEGAEIRPANLINLNIGLFCMENFDSAKLHKLIQEKTLPHVTSPFVLLNAVWLRRMDLFRQTCGETGNISTFKDALMANRSFFRTIIEVLARDV